MSEGRRLFSLIKRMTYAERNVGPAGGDLTARILAATALLALTLTAFPPLGLPYPALAIASLLCALLGGIFLALGIFFSQKTHYAGLTLIPASLCVVFLAGIGMPWIAVAVGLTSCAGGLVNILTRRCGLNRLFGINSCTPVHLPPS